MQMQISALIVTSDVQIAIAAATLLAIAAIWLAPAALVASLRDAAVDAAHALFPPLHLPDWRRAWARLAQLLAGRGRRARAMARPATRSAVSRGTAATRRASVSPAAAASAASPSVVVEMARLTDQRVWDQISARAMQRVDRTAAARRLQRQAGVQIDAARYGLDRLRAELAFVMPPQGRPGLRPPGELRPADAGFASAAASGLAIAA